MKIKKVGLFISITFLVTFFCFIALTYWGFYNRTTSDSIDISFYQTYNTDQIKMDVNLDWLERPEYNPEGVSFLAYVSNQRLTPIDNDLKFEEFPLLNEKIIEKLNTLEDINIAPEQQQVYLQNIKNNKSLNGIHFEIPPGADENTIIRVFYVHGYAAPMGEMELWIKEGLYVGFCLY